MQLDYLETILQLLKDECDHLSQNNNGFSQYASKFCAVRLRSDSCHSLAGYIYGANEPLFSDPDSPLRAVGFDLGGKLGSTAYSSFLMKSILLCV